MIQIGPLVSARREWHQAQKHLAEWLDAWKINRHVNEAAMLAHAYENERALYDEYEALVMAEMEAEVRASRA